jgi:hypothetical protein
MRDFLEKLLDYGKELRKQNRIQKRTPKSGIFWCNGCDANLVENVPKCSVCGSRNIKSTRRNKHKDQ